MPLITYKFADRHTEEIEVSEEVAAAFEQFLIYEEKVKRKEPRRHKSLEKLAEKGFDLPAANTDYFEIKEKQRQEQAQKRCAQATNPTGYVAPKAYAILVDEVQKAHDCRAYI